MNRVGELAVLLFPWNAWILADASESARVGKITNSDDARNGELRRFLFANLSRAASITIDVATRSTDVRSRIYIIKAHSDDPRE